MSKFKVLREMSRVPMDSSEYSWIVKNGLDIIFSYSWSKAFYLNSLGGWILLSTGRSISGVKEIVTVISTVLFSWVSSLDTWGLLSHSETQYSAAEYTRPRDADRRLSAVALQEVGAIFCLMLSRVLILAAVFSICFRNERVLFRIMPNYFGKRMQ